jgi:hypothetical protein
LIRTIWAELKFITGAKPAGWLAWPIYTSSSQLDGSQHYDR